MKTKVDCRKYMVKCITVELCERLGINLKHMWYEWEILQNFFRFSESSLQLTTMKGLVNGRDSRPYVETKLGVFEELQSYKRRDNMETKVHHL